MSRSPETPDRQPSLGRVLVVDDDRRMASGTAQWLCGLGWHASAVGSADEAIPLLGRGRFDACVVDGLLPDRAAERLLTIVQAASPTTGIVVALPSHVVAGAALAAAADALTDLPIRDDHLLAAIERACGAGRARAASGAASVAAAPGKTVLGSHPTICQALDIVDRIAATPATV
ncbi:MAG: hypothetical protein WCJ18_10925, partial [Planctomycetota bacterium]